MHLAKILLCLLIGTTLRPMIMMVGIPILRSTKISEFLTFNLSIFVKISKKRYGCDARLEITN